MDLIEPRSGTHLIDREGCLELLAQHQQGIGRVAVIDGGKPIILPINYAMAEDRVVFRTGIGTKLDVACRGEPVAFEIDRIDHSTHSGWSVLVSGRAEVVTEPEQLLMLGGLGLESFLSDREHWVMIHPTTVTGRRIPPGTTFGL